MGDLNWGYLIDGAAAVYGLYMLLSALKMKVSGTLSSFVASPEELNQCTDISGLIKRVWIPMTVFGLLTLAYGVTNIINALVWNHTMYELASLLVFLAACILFILYLQRARKKYLKR